MLLAFSCTTKNSENAGPYPPYLEANVEVIDYTYEHIENLNMHWVYITYEIENTGQYLIDYYEAWFEVGCSGFIYYEDWMNGTDLLPGEKRVDYAYVYTNGENVITVYASYWYVHNPDLGWFPAY